MNIKCTLRFHEWQGCKCSSCGKIRDEGHDWSYCMCAKCEKVRLDGNDWSSKCMSCVNLGFPPPDHFRGCKVRRMLLAQSLGRPLELLHGSGTLPRSISGIG